MAGEAQVVKVGMVPTVYRAQLSLLREHLMCDMCDRDGVRGLTLSCVLKATSRLSLSRPELHDPKGEFSINPRPICCLSWWRSTGDQTPDPALASQVLMPLR